MVKQNINSTPQVEKKNKCKEMGEKENIRPNPFTLNDGKHLRADKSYLKGNRTEDPLYLPQGLHVGFLLQ